MTYQPSTLNKDDSSAIASIERNLISAVDDSLNHLKILEQALEMYKSTVGNSIDATLEYADIINKYTEPDKNSSTYGLPGVMATTVASYDLEAIRADNSKLQDRKEAKESSSRQRDSYFKTAARSFSALRSDLNGVGDYNQRLFAFLEMLNKKI